MKISQQEGSLRGVSFCHESYQILSCDTFQQTVMKTQTNLTRCDRVSPRPGCHHWQESCPCANVKHIDCQIFFLHHGHSFDDCFIVFLVLNNTQFCDLLAKNQLQDNTFIWVAWVKILYIDIAKYQRYSIWNRSLNTITQRCL